MKTPREYAYDAVKSAGKLYLKEWCDVQTVIEKVVESVTIDALETCAQLAYEVSTRMRASADASRDQDTRLQLMCGYTTADEITDEIRALK